MSRIQNLWLYGAFILFSCGAQETFDGASTVVPPDSLPPSLGFRFLGLVLQVEGFRV